MPSNHFPLFSGTWACALLSCHLCHAWVCKGSREEKLKVQPLGQIAWVPTLAPPFTSYVTTGKFLNFSESQLSQWDYHQPHGIPLGAWNWNSNMMSTQWILPTITSKMGQEWFCFLQHPKGYLMLPCTHHLIFYGYCPWHKLTTCSKFPRVLALF